jgi:hypothetical protein
LRCPNCESIITIGTIECHFCHYQISNQATTIVSFSPTDSAVAPEATSTLSPSARTDTTSTLETHRAPVLPDQIAAIEHDLREDTYDDTRRISLVALFLSMFAFIVAFANFFYNSFGTSQSFSTINLTTNVTTTVYYPKSFILFGFPMDGLVLSFLVGIFAFVVATTVWIILMRLSGEFRSRL